MKSLKEFKPLWSFIKEDKTKIIIAGIIIFITEVVNTLGGYLNGQAVESITKLELKRALLFLSIYLINNIVIDAWLYMKGYSMLQKVENKMSRKLSFNTYKKSLNLPAYAFEKMSSGEIINRITNDADTLSFVIGRLIQTATSIIGAVVILVYVFINSYIIGIEIVLFMLTLFFVIKKYNPILIKLHKERKKEQDRFSSLVNESIRGIREIKTLGVKNNLINDVLEIIKTLFNKSVSETDAYREYKTIVKIIRSLLEFSVYATCVFLLYKSHITLAYFVAMTYYVYKFMYLIDEVNDLTEMYHKLIVSITRVNEILENRLYKDDEFGNNKIKNIFGKIVFNKVKFHYPNERLLLNNFNLSLEPNKKIAIVGASGQGKSTLFNLLTRLFDPTEGKINIDGIDLKSLSEEELRKNISIIRQEPFIFNRTILENFKLINKKIKLKEVKEYCKMAYLNDYIMSLPKKYNTVLGEGGVNLSGGQKQRLSIARTLAKNSKIVLFDEATSALDNNSQEFIKRSIDSLVKDHTVIIVAHRLSTIIDADIIYVVDKGKVIGQGTHNQLLIDNPIYRKLYETESLNS